MDAAMGIDGFQSSDGETAAPLQARHVTHLTFDGSAAEYFRLWVIHTLLCVVTLGLYSPWAKVRKARWFAQHTSLMGQRFDYHGRPWPILLGRCVALALFIAWTFSFELSLALGLAVLGILCAIGPLLFANAQRFRLASTSWRGLRFDFHVPRRELYAVCVPALLVWTLGSVLQSAGAPLWAVLSVSGCAVLFLPLAHARLKAMQHSHASFGGHGFSYEGSTSDFYTLYFKAAGILLGAGVVASGVMIFVNFLAKHIPVARGAVSAVLAGLAVIVITWVLAWPYFAARMQAIVWPRTRMGPVGFTGEMRARRLLAIVAKGSFLTLLTAGLYWPFLAVEVARYRVESLAVVSPEPLDGMPLVANPGAATGTVGDAAADFFGFDLGW